MNSLSALNLKCDLSRCENDGSFVAVKNFHTQALGDPDMFFKN